MSEPKEGDERGRRKGGEEERSSEGDGGPSISPVEDPEGGERGRGDKQKVGEGEWERRARGRGDLASAPTPTWLAETPQTVCSQQYTHPLAMCVCVCVFVFVRACVYVRHKSGQHHQ